MYVNRQIYDTPFENPIIDDEKVTNWQMPGISADISNITNQNIKTVPVMCAMKLNLEIKLDEILQEKDNDGTSLYKVLIRDTNMYNRFKERELNDIYKQSNLRIDGIEEKLNGKEFLKYLLCQRRILKCNDWGNIFNGINIAKNVYNFEHTERQLLLYHLFNMDGDKWRTNGVEYIKGKASINERSLLMYTNGAPCFFEDRRMLDNGGTCCWNIYRLANRHIDVQVYFSDLNCNSVLNDQVAVKNIFNMNIVDVINGILTHQSVLTNYGIERLKQLNLSGDVNWKNTMTYTLMSQTIDQQHNTIKELLDNSNWPNSSIQFTWLKRD